MDNAKNEQFLVVKSVENQVPGKPCNQRAADVKKFIGLKTAQRS
jgi:hypothetical protein